MPEPNDPTVRARVGFTSREYLDRGEQGGDGHDGGGRTDVLEAQIANDGAVGDIADADPDDKPEREGAVDEPGARYRMFLGEFRVEVEQLRVHRQREIGRAHV